MFCKHESDSERRIRQVRERQARLEARNIGRVEQELLQKRKHHQSWIRPWSHARRHIRAYPIYEREAMFHNYIPLNKLPQSLLEIPQSKLVTPTKRLRQEKRPLKELGTPLGVFSTSADQDELDSSQLKVTSPKKGKFEFSPRSLFISKIGHNDTSVIADSRPSSREPIVSTEGTNPEANSPILVLGEVLTDTTATAIAAPGTIPVPAPILGQALVPVLAVGPSVPIIVQMGAIGDHTTSVAPLPTFIDGQVQIQISISSNS